MIRCLYLSDNALRLLALVVDILYWGLQVMSSFSIWGCILKGYFDRWYILKGQIMFKWHWRLQSWALFTWFPFQWANRLLLVGNLSDGWLLKGSYPARPHHASVCGGPALGLWQDPPMWAQPKRQGGSDRRSMWNCRPIKYRSQFMFQSKDYDCIRKPEGISGHSFWK
jgi:hypothetical protein